MKNRFGENLARKRMLNSTHRDIRAAHFVNKKTKSPMASLCFRSRSVRCPGGEGAESRRIRQQDGSVQRPGGKGPSAKRKGQTPEAKGSGRRAGGSKQWAAASGQRAVGRVLVQRAAGGGHRAMGDQQRAVGRLLAGSGWATGSWHRRGHRAATRWGFS